MTEIGLSNNVSALINSVVAGGTATTSSTSTTTDITSSTKKELSSLNIDTTNIKTEEEAQAAIKAAEKKLALQGTNDGTQKTEDIEDTVTISNAAKKASASD